MTETILSIDGITLPAGSVRGMSEELRWLDPVKVVRDLNFTLQSFALPASRKLALTLSADGQLRAPGLMELTVGDTLTVTPTSDLEESVATGTSSKVLQRAPATGSLTLLTADMVEITSGFTLTTKTITFDSPTTQPLLARYRPGDLSMMVTAPVTRRNNEWSASVGWTLELEEV